MCACVCVYVCVYLEDNRKIKINFLKKISNKFSSTLLLVKRIFILIHVDETYEKNSLRYNITTGKMIKIVNDSQTTTAGTKLTPE